MGVADTIEQTRTCVVNCWLVHFRPKVLCRQLMMMIGRLRPSIGSPTESVVHKFCVGRMTLVDYQEPRIAHKRSHCYSWMKLLLAVGGGPVLANVCSFCLLLVRSFGRLLFVPVFVRCSFVCLFGCLFDCMAVCSLLHSFIGLPCCFYSLPLIFFGWWFTFKWIYHIFESRVILHFLPIPILYLFATISFSCNPICFD